ncbi:metal-sensing transcriptional repressor, partial [Salmonella enterica]
MSTHTSHPDIINRLKRAEGHLRSIIAMMETGRGCL